MNEEEKDKLKYLIYKVERLEKLLFKVCKKLDIIYKSEELK